MRPAFLGRVLLTTAIILFACLLLPAGLLAQTVYETENCTVAASSGEVHAIVTNASASGGKFTNLESNAINDYVNYRGVDVPVAGTYNVKVRVVKSSNGGICQVNASGSNQGSPIDLYASSLSFVEVDLGTKNFGTTGPKPFKITVTGKNAASSGYVIAIDTITLTLEEGSASGPEVKVEGNAVKINDGDTTPQTADKTDFGSVDLTSGSVTHTYTIRNTGTAALTLNSVTITGSNATDFVVTAQPVGPVAAGGSATFDVKFDPSASGVRTASLSFDNNDANENPYNFQIQGAGTTTTGGGGPEAKVEGNGVEIVDGDTTPQTADKTDFGSVAVTSGSVTHTYTIWNTGTATLTFNSVTITGSNATDFVVTAQPAGSVAAGGSTTFSVKFDPSASGVRTANLSFDNNDANENPYNFQIQGAGTTTTGGGSEKPNFIVIFTDDLGLDMLSCYGAAHPTPHLDALAGGGIRFELGYVAPVCGPSRAQVLTGRYPFRTGCNYNNTTQTGLEPGKEVMISKVLKTAGYVTMSAGKWGQHSNFGPHLWDFDESLEVAMANRYWPDGSTPNTINGQPVLPVVGEYTPDTMHQFVTDFMTRHKDEPFFIYYPMLHMHRLLEKTPDSAPGAAGGVIRQDNLNYMDKLVGQLVSKLEQLNLRQKTVILFIGDNGSGGPQPMVGGKKIFGKKGEVNEGGAHVPFIANWPGTTPTGVVSRDLVDSTDVFVTLAELAGATLPANVTLDGKSFAPQLKGQTGTPREWVYVELNGDSFAREARYKLTNHGEMFDLINAPYDEIPVPANSADPAVIAARQLLQQVLDTHPAAPASH